MKRFSHIWLWVSLGLLGIFLAIWVHDSYQEEKNRLEGEIKLELAHVLLASVDIDFSQLINVLKIGETGDQPKTFSINIDSLQGINGRRVKTAIRFDSRQTSDTFFRQRIITDSNYHGLPIPLRGDTTWIAGSQVLIATTHDQDLASDSIWQDIFPEEYQVEFDEAISKVPGHAFIGIIPQLLLALGLFSTIIFAILMLQRNHRQKELEMETKNQFIGNMTHELKTPVATIGIALEAIQDFSVDPQKANQYMATSRSELKRLSQLIDQVMAASQTHHDPESYRKEVISFPEVVQAVLNSLNPQIEEKQANLSVKMQEENAVILGDVSHLANMLRNLLDNSLKYSKEGVEIQLQVTIEKDRLICSVQDNGIGIPARFQQKVFDQFFRVPTGDIHTIKGYGLGLNYVAQVVKAHKGKIQLNSKEGEGTEVSIHFPIHHG